MLRLREDALFTASKSIADPTAGFHFDVGVDPDGHPLKQDGMNYQRKIAVVKIDVLPTDGITVIIGDKTHTFRDTVTDPLTEIKIGNLVTNGDFVAVGVNWINYGNWVITTGKATHTDGTPIPENSFTQTLNQEWFPKPIVGYTYATTFIVANRTAGSVRIKIGGTVGTVRSTNATFAESLVAVSNGDLQFVPTADFDGEISAVTVTNTNTDLKGLTAQALGDKINIDKASTKCTAYALGLTNLIALIANVVGITPTLTVDGTKLLKDKDWANVVTEAILENTNYFKRNISTEGDVKPVVLVERNAGTWRKFLY